MRHALVLGLVALTAASCATKTVTAAAPGAGDVASVPAVSVRDGGGAWTNDPRWKPRLAEVDAASAAATARLTSETGLAFERGREPIVAFDPAAPLEGDVAVRLIDGVRRPIVRVAPAALLRGEFRAKDDFPPLLVEGAILVGAGEREPPAWVRKGVALVIGGGADRRLRQRVLAGPEVEVREDVIFPAAAADPLRDAARASALARIARADRPFTRFLQLVFAGTSEDAALAAMGVARREFLDAASDTERARALRSVADDPILRALRDARAALGRRETDRADALLAPLADELADPSNDAWLAADARLCLAQIALARGETRNARAAYDAAAATQKILRVRDARIVETCVAPPAQRLASLRALVADYPDAATSGPVSSLVPVPPQLAAKYPSTAGDVVSADGTTRRTAAVRLGESATQDAAPVLRLLVADPDAGVRRAAVAALAVVLGSQADDDVELATHDADAGVRRTALDLLAASNRQRAAKRAASMKDDADAGIRARALELSRPK